MFLGEATFQAEKSMSTKVGVLGGGQLGRMLAEAASPLGIELFSLDPNPDCPTSHSLPSSRCIQGDFRDARAVAKFMALVDVVTFEIEHINVAALESDGGRAALIVI